MDTDRMILGLERIRRLLTNRDRSCSIDLWCAIVAAEVDDLIDEARYPRSYAQGPVTMAEVVPRLAELQRRRQLNHRVKNNKVG